ncbi:MAG: hypothetical protein R3Y62_08165 [Eubacteriales bacterium]
MIGLLIALAILLALAFLPVGIWVSYDNEDFTIKVPFWLWKIGVYPKKPKKTEKKKAEKPEKKREIPIEISLESILELLELLARFVGKTGKRLRVEEVDLQVICGGGNAATVALDYGKICALVSATEPLFDSVFRAKKKNIQVDLDFEARTQSTIGTIDIRLCLASLLYLAAYLAKHGFTFYRKRKKAA